MAADAATSDSLMQTPLTALNRELGGRMVGFAGYDMPVQFEGIMAEHNWTRAKAGLFDVSHMGQCILRGTSHEAVADALESLVPASIRELKPGRQRYACFLNEDGGVLDDLMVTNAPWLADPAIGTGALFLVVNAACKHADYTLMREKLAGRAALEVIEDRALIALQGPKARDIMGGICAPAAALTFMAAGAFDAEGVPLWASCSGYTGEDGYEISVPAEGAEALARRLLAFEDVKPVGLGARDSLRLDAGLCLYGHDMDETTSPVEANITFAIGKRRRAQGGFPGAERILAELENGPARLRVGILPEGRAPAREGTEIHDADGKAVGQVTSGGFSPTLQAPVAMGYVDAARAGDGTRLNLMVRGKALPAKVAPMPFVKQTYFRG